MMISATKSWLLAGLAVALPLALPAGPAQAQCRGRGMNTLQTPFGVQAQMSAYPFGALPAQLGAFPANSLLAQQYAAQAQLSLLQQYALQSQLLALQQAAIQARLLGATPNSPAFTPFNAAAPAGNQPTPPRQTSRRRQTQAAARADRPAFQNDN